VYSSRYTLRSSLNHRTGVAIHLEVCITHPKVLIWKLSILVSSILGVIIAVHHRVWIISLTWCAHYTLRCILDTVYSKISPQCVWITPQGVHITPHGVHITPWGICITPQGVHITPYMLWHLIHAWAHHLPGNWTLHMSVHGLQENNNYKLKRHLNTVHECINMNWISCDHTGQCIVCMCVGEMKLFAKNVSVSHWNCAHAFISLYYTKGVGLTPQRVLPLFHCYTKVQNATCSSVISLCTLRIQIKALQQVT
jgi:hypothetical protein